MFFKKTPTMLYDFYPNGKLNYYSVKDITQNVRFIKEFLNNVTIYDEYDIQDGETPELVAEKVYGNPNYHWIILLANEIYDPVEDWPLPQYALETFITRKYENPQEIHHYIDENGNVVDQDNPTAVGVSNYQYEESINESKRRIKLLTQDAVNFAVKEFSTLFSNR